MKTIIDSRYKKLCQLRSKSENILIFQRERRICSRTVIAPSLEAQGVPKREREGRRENTNLEINPISMQHSLLTLQRHSIVGR